METLKSSTFHAFAKSKQANYMAIGSFSLVFAGGDSRPPMLASSVISAVFAGDMSSDGVSSISLFADGFAGENLEVHAADFNAARE